MAKKDLAKLALLASLLLTLVWLARMVPPAWAAPWQEKVDPLVLENSASGEGEFLLYLSEQADLGAAATLDSKLQKGRYVYEKLTATAARTQPGVIAELRRLEADFRPFWIANMILVRGDATVMEAMARRPDVAHLYANPRVRLPEQPISERAPSTTAPGEIEWNIQQVGAPVVWAAGYTGQGVVIGGQDTGYQWDHPALKEQYRGWDGTTADHNYNWNDATGDPCGWGEPEPCDDHGHGTHTMGTLVGDDGADNRIGMAPGAKWIGCRNMDGGVGTPATYSACFQWFLAPTDLQGQGPDLSKAPDIINNSWGCPPEEGCIDPTVLQAVTANVRAAGIAVVASAGNRGPSCSTIRDPLAIYDATITVAATDSLDFAASFSSRGPVTVDGSNRLKPDLSAPGVGIRSAYPLSVYGVSSGTSMAAPHVAGAIALLLSAQPSLRGQVDQIEAILQATALPRTTTQGCGGDTPTSIPNNTYGFGRLDVSAAMRSLPHALAVEKEASASLATPGGLLSYTLSIDHQHPFSPTSKLVLTDVLPTGTSFVAATQPYSLQGDLVRWEREQLGAGESWQVQLTVRLLPTAPFVIRNEEYGVESADVAYTAGPPLDTPVSRYELFSPLVYRTE